MNDEASFERKASKQGMDVSVTDGTPESSEAQFSAEPRTGSQREVAHKWPDEVKDKMSDESGSPKLVYPPTKEDLQRLYVDEKLSAMKIAKVYDLKYASPKTAESTILYHLKRNGIARRDATAHVRKVTAAMVDEWVARYEKGESLKQIAGDFVDPVTVFVHLHKRGLKLRDKVEAQIKAVKKFEKFSFDGTEEDQAYLLGFVRGDLGVSRHGRAIRVKTGSTHPAMIDLVLSLFKPYGPVRVYPRFSKLVGYEWTIEAELDSTFEFLLSQKLIPPAKDAHRKVVLHYLAGLFDAEGSVWLRTIRSFAPRLSVANKDTSMLDWIERQLTGLEVYWHRSRPDKNGICQTQIWRNADILKLLRAMPLRHPEKKAKTRLLLGFERESFDLQKRWAALLSEIEFDRLQFIELAKQDTAKRRNDSPNLQDWRDPIVI
jgi:hypothetical protein